MENTSSQKPFYFIIGGALALLLFWGGLQIYGTWYDEWSGYNASLSVSDGYCNIAVVPMFGDVLSYADANVYDIPAGEVIPPSINPDAVESMLSAAEDDPMIKGILAEIDSYGGSGAGGQMIANRLKASPLPTAISIRDAAASAAYLIASGADTIFAMPFSDVGSIGVTMSYIDNSIQNENEGLSFVSLASGKFKDSGTPDKPLTEEERALFERDLKFYHEALVKSVAANRNIPEADVAALADGSTMSAVLGLEHKLVDALGDREATKEWFSNQLNIPKEEVIFCL